MPSPKTDDFTPRPKGYHLLVDKTDRKMTMFVSGKEYRSYTVYLGFAPTGHKTRRGDGRTPEGTYYVCRRNTESSYYRSLLISYPSLEDARNGVESGLVNKSTLDAVISAYERRSTPPQDTRIGGSICIHGEGSRSRPQTDWTAGCIAVTNEEMDEIFSLVPLGTPVTIRP
ncbi:MAG: L,D-transpeptidase family protein [Armatimonadetes bacterium]|nr:L,D-transpeptidase family protein [Armatimonadota bacterium]